MFRFCLTVFAGVLLCSLFVQPAGADWVVKNGWIDYCQHKITGDTTQYTVDGMPDFDERQDNWYTPTYPHKWNWCGPVAAANCLWWFDSKFEMVKCKSLLPGTQVRPLTISDHYPLVRSFLGTSYDDHNPGNVVPFVTALGWSQAGGVPPAGMTGLQMKTMIENYLASDSVNLRGHYTVRLVLRPSFEWIYSQVDSSQDLIALLGFWQSHLSGEWTRFGGHWVTIAGVDTQNQLHKISVSDPIQDRAESGHSGVVRNGWLNPHNPGHGVANHNDAGNVSHDWYGIWPSNSPGGAISPDSFGYDWSDSMWVAFEGLNVPDTLIPYVAPYDPLLNKHVEIEEVVMVCPNFDYGDLGEDYPTIDVESCGPAHPLTDKAWLGDSIDSEVQPRILDHDNSDDGVGFNGLPWTPGQNGGVVVWVTTGAHHADEPLYLEAWMDGNLDGDFDDGPDDPPFTPPEEDSMQCSEWVIQDVLLPGPGFSPHSFCVPGIANHPITTKIRFRLTSQPVGRYGYGGYWGGGVSNGRGTYDIDWVLGEVEDYVRVYVAPVTDLVIKIISVADPITLYWTCPEDGMYYIYSTTNKNNHGDPRHESGWVEEMVLTLPPGPVTVTLPPMTPTETYKNYVIVYETP
jgi:hypothetical protein